MWVRIPPPSFTKAPGFTSRDPEACRKEQQPSRNRLEPPPELREEIRYHHTAQATIYGPGIISEMACLHGPIL